MPLSWKQTIDRHPNLITWLGLSLGFLGVLAWSARGMALGLRAWAVLALAAVLVAGACARIIAWEADIEPEEPGDAAQEDE